MFKFSLKLIGRGWTKATITNGSEEISVTGTYLSDAIRDFIMVITTIVEGAENVTCSWQEEPGQYRWLISRRDGSIELSILWYDKAFSHQRNEDGQQIFSCTADLRRFGKSVQRELDRMVYEYGVEGYKRTWNYDFPLRELDRLRTALDQLSY